MMQHFSGPLLDADFRLVGGMLHDGARSEN